MSQHKWKVSEVVFFFSLWINYLSNLAIKSHNSPSYHSLSFCYFSSLCLFQHLFKMATNSHISFKMSSLKVPRYRELTSSSFHKILCVSAAVSELYRNEKSLLLIRNTCSSEKKALCDVTEAPVATPSRSFSAPSCLLSSSRHVEGEQPRCWL